MIRNSVAAYSRITRCRVLSVNTTAYTCDLTSIDDAGRTYRDVAWAAAYASPRGHAIDYCPAQGDTALVLEKTSNDQDARDDSPIILAWSFEQSGARFGKFRPPMQPGDIHLSTRMGAKILLDGQEGDLLVQAGPACGWSFFRGRQLAELLCDTYELNTQGGSTLWGVYGQGDLDSDEVMYRMSIKSRRGDEMGFLRIFAGLDETGQEVVTLSVCEPTLEGESRAIGYGGDLDETPNRGVHIVMRKSGEMKVHARSSLNVSANTSINLTTLGSLARQCTFSTETCGDETGSSVSMDVNQREVTTTSYTLSAQEVRLQDRVTGESYFYAANEDEVEGKNNRLVHEQLLEWLFTHTHPTPSGPSSLPLAAPTIEGVAANASADQTATIQAAIAEKTALATAFTALATLAPASAELFTAAGQAATDQVTKLNEALVAASAPHPFAVSSVDDVITQETKAR